MEMEEEWQNEQDGIESDQESKLETKIMKSLQ